MLAETYGVGPFQAGGGGGAGGGGAGSARGAGCSAATQLSDGGSYRVPWPHSVALLIPGDTSVTNASGASATAVTIVKRRNMSVIADFPPKVLPDPCRGEESTTDWEPISQELTIALATGVQPVGRLDERSGQPTCAIFNTPHSGSRGSLGRLENIECDDVGRASEQSSVWNPDEPRSGTPW